MDFRIPYDVFRNRETKTFNNDTLLPMPKFFENASSESFRDILPLRTQFIQKVKTKFFGDAPTVRKPIDFQEHQLRVSVMPSCLLESCLMIHLPKFLRYALKQSQIIRKTNTVFFSTVSFHVLFKVPKIPSVKSFCTETLGRKVPILHLRIFFSENTNFSNRKITSVP